MGLDSFWLEPEKNDKGEYDTMEVETDEPIQLCGGMMSGSGCGSFRGKVYDDIVDGVTGESLYQEMINNETVRAMADALEAADYDTYYGLDKPKTGEPLDNIQDVFAGSNQISREEFADLQRMFRLYADAGANLHGWW